jgi:hypothetical protein
LHSFATAASRYLATPWRRLPRLLPHLWAGSPSACPKRLKIRPTPARAAGIGVNWGNTIFSRPFGQIFARPRGGDLQEAHNGRNAAVLKLARRIAMPTGLPADAPCGAPSGAGEQANRGWRPLSLSATYPTGGEAQTQACSRLRRGTIAARLDRPALLNTSLPARVGRRPSNGAGISTIRNTCIRW